MTPMVPVALFGWPLVTLAAFLLVSPQRAVVISVIGGVLFLPMASYNWPGIPEYDKTTAIGVGLLLGGLVSRGPDRFRLRLHGCDLPVVVLCFVVPLASALSNSLGWYDGISRMIRSYLTFGVLFWAGRRYFSNANSLLVLARGVVLGGLLYVPLILFESRMSPQLSNIFYGFFPHEWIQHIRYGGYRPIVFMQHGLMVALWMAACTTVGYWLWRDKLIANVGGVPIPLAVFALAIATVLCRSANGVVLVALGIAAHVYYGRSHSTQLFQLLVLSIPLYMTLRMADLVSIEQVGSWAGTLFDDERVASLLIRLRQEELFGARAMQRAWFGWGGYGRGWPVDQFTGEHLIAMVDAQWVIILSNHGLVGLVSYFVSLGLGPWLVLRAHSRLSRSRGRFSGSSVKATLSVVLSLMVVIFMIDSLANSMQGQIYVLTAGALVTASLGDGATDCSSRSK